MPNISKINGLQISAADAQYVAAGNVDGPLGYNSIESANTASYINPTFISASAAASGFGSGGGGSTTAQTASLALTVTQSQAGAGSGGTGLHRVALLDTSDGTTPIYFDHNGITYNVTTNTLTVNGPISAYNITASLQGTASWATNAITASYALTSAGTVSNATSASFAATASYVNTLNQNVTINGNLNVTGTASYAYVSASTLDVGTNTISVNVAEPAQRFGGLVVYDSGSLSHQATASLFWDSLNNKWIYQNASGSTYSGGMLISGPRNTGAIGEEVGTTNNALMKGQGGDHITSSRIFDDGTNVYTNSNVQITGSLTVTGNVIATASWATNAISSSYATVADNTSTININVFGADVDSYLLMSNVAGATGVSIGGDADLRYNTSTNKLTVGNVAATTLTGSLLGNVIGSSSWATNATSASYTVSASYANQAASASYVLNAVSSSYAANGGVTQLIAGSNIVLSPTNGLGAVTISSTGGGSSGAGANVTASFTNQSTWTFTHALSNRGVVVQTYDTSWNQIIPENITLTDSNTATITFPSNESGYAIASLGGVVSTAATASYVLNAVSASFAATASYVLNAISSSFASTASFVNTLNQNVIITGSVAIGTGSVGSGENNLLLGPAPAGGTGEGGQIAFLAAGGSYTSSSFIDNWQNQFRILRGPGSVSNAGLMYMNLQSGNTQFVGAVTASAYSGLPNSWMHALRTSNQTIGSGTWADRDIIFDQLASNNFTYNSSTGIATLKAGKTYRITARLAWSAAGLYTLKFRIYNQTTSAFTGPTVELIQSPNGTYNVSDGTLESIFTVGASDVDISIRTTADTNALTGEYIRGDLNTQLIIQQIA